VNKRILIICLLLLCSTPIWAATYTVTNCADSGAGSLRQAILDAGSSDEIIFDITTLEAGYSTGEVGPGLVTNEAGSNTWFRIMVNSSLPSISTTNISIRGSTQTREANNSLGPEVEVRGRDGLDGFYFTSTSGDNGFIEGLIINGFAISPHFGIRFAGQGNTVYGCYIGTTASGEAAYPNHWGIWINNNFGNLVGSTEASNRNLISGNNQYGIYINGASATNNEILGNYIGTNSSGTANVGNGTAGIIISSGANNNKIGNATAGGRNVISGNSNYGIFISNSGSNSNEILGNYIGTDPTGTVDLGNATHGVSISQGQNNKIGNSTAGGRNIISGNNQSGISISLANNNEILGNYIGTDVNGTADLGNTQRGVFIINNSKYNNVGNGTAGGRNIISGNNLIGIVISDSGTNSNEVVGNYIGTTVDGSGALANSQHGVKIQSNAWYNQIGNGSAGGRNIISGNTLSGINIENTNSNEVIGNYIGTTVSGEAPLQNDQYGIQINGSYNIIGGNTSTPGTASGNLISGNDWGGILITGSGSAYNRILGNLIGTNQNGTSAIPNSAGAVINGGIYLLGSAHHNYVGDGTTTGKNIISGNTKNGIYFSNASSNEVLGNYIGTDINGTAALGNSGNAGIQIASGSHFNLIGNGTAGGRNVICKNAEGFYINGTNITNNVISGNYIGLDAAGSALGNNNHGLLIQNGPTFNTIGPNNTIAHNTTDGIYLNSSSTTHEVITQNSIFANSGKGISLAGGANNGITPPSIGSADHNEATGQTLLSGIATDEPNGTIEVFKAEGDQGKTYLGSTLADGSGNWSVSVSGLVSGDAVVVTGTTSNPSTSEFSQTKEVITTIFKEYQPDNRIATLESGADYIGENIINTDGTNQTRARTITTGTSATYYIQVENDANTTDEVIVSGPASSGDWTLTYYDAKTGGNNITSSIIGSGWSTGTLTTGESKEIRMVVTNTGSTTSTFEALVTSESNTDTAFKDAVKAITTALSPPTDLNSFSINLPSTTIQGSAFNTTITALDSLGSVETNVIGTTDLLIDTGTITPESIAESSFTNGVWTGNITLNKIGQRTITASNEGSTGTGQVIVLNSTLEITSNGVTITVPAGASSQEVSISVTETTSSPGNPPPGYVIAGTMYNFTSTPTDFLLPVTVTIPITGPLADGRVYYWDGTAWSNNGITIVSVTDTSLTFTTTHLSLFAPVQAAANNLVRFGPNPYNPNSGTPAKIWYWLNADASTSIYVVDTAGTLVWKNSYTSGSNGGRAGSNDIDFNGKNTWGNILGNGVYIYKIVQGGKAVGGGKIAIIK
jgi:hypothetical protein